MRGGIRGVKMIRTNLGGRGQFEKRGVGGTGGRANKNKKTETKILLGKEGGGNRVNDIKLVWGGKNPGEYTKNKGGDV